MSWVVGRQVAEFYVLHSKLVQQCVWLKSSQLPAVSSKSLFGKSNDRAYLERARDKLQSFLDVIASSGVSFRSPFKPRLQIRHQIRSNQIGSRLIC